MADSESSPKEELTVGTTMKELGQEMKMLYISWSNTLSDGENFEVFCQKRIDALIKEALAVEARLKKQKESLRQRLHLLTKTLQERDDEEN